MIVYWLVIHVEHRQIAFPAIHLNIKTHGHLYDKILVRWVWLDVHNTLVSLPGRVCACPFWLS